MLCNDPEYVKIVNENLVNVRSQDLLPKDHQKFLDRLKVEFEFEPAVCYDIGSCVLHWTRHAERVWEDVKVYLFDAFSPVEQFYEKI